MSDQVFPTLHTSSWKMSRTPVWGTTVKTAVSGDRHRAPLQTSPRWRWTLKNGVLQSAYNDLQAIQNLYVAMYGRLDWFKWKDPEGETIADPTQQIGDFWPVAFTEDSMDFDRFAYQLWECGTVEFEQVLFAQGGVTTGGGGGGSTGPTTTGTLSVLSSHIQGTTYSGNAWASNGVVALNFGGEPSGSVFMRDSGAWTLRTNTVTISTADPSSLVIEFSIAGSLLGSTTPADEFRIYDVMLDVTNPDGTTSTLRPRVATAVPDGQGAVTDAANAIDGLTGTYASITRSLFGPGVNTAPLLQLSNFS